MEDSTGGAEAPKSVAQRSSDGALDFSSYSLAQLKDLQSLVDPATQPLNHERLMAEIARRTANEPAVAPGSGRFTRRDGWRGWLEAKRRRSPVYGTGSLSLEADRLTLQGWQRTWLGVSSPGVIELPLERVRNVARDGEWLRFEMRRRWLPSQHVRFKAASAHETESLVQQLPKTQSPGFERRWHDMRQFHEHAAALAGNSWPVYALALANLAMFIVLAIVHGRVWHFDAQTLVRWGANYGPVTLDAQWWRLLSAQFLHGDIFHLLANLWVLLNAGRLARQLYGSFVFLGIYLGSGICGFVLSLAWEPAGASVGASGALFGILAAFLAFMVRQRRQLPAPLLRAHWLSTSLFVAFNLVSGMLQEHIDNAAHVGGMLSGFLMGWLLARPLNPELRPRWPIWQSLTSLGLVATVTLTGLWWQHGIGARPTAFDRFGREHPWYVRGETENLERWQLLATHISSGTISRAELSRQMRQDILPFWQDAYRRFSEDERFTKSPAGELPATMLEFTRLRRDWADALADAAEDDDAERGADAVRLMEETNRVQARIDRLSLPARMEYRPRALKHSLFVNRLRNLLSLDEWRCIEGQPRVGRKISDQDSPTDAPALRHRVGCRAQKLFHDRDYRALENLMRDAARKLGDLPDGSSSLTAIFSSLSTMMSEGGHEVEALMGRTADWRRAVDDPLMAELAEIMIFQEWAWSARGGGTVEEVSGMGWFLFAQRSEMAAAGLAAIEKSGESSPLWHDFSLETALDLSRTKEQIRAVFDRGIRTFPDYLPLYRGMLRVLMPRWLGSYEEVDQFIREMTAYTSREPNLALYARLYWQYFLLEQDEHDIFVEGHASWPDIDAGFAELRRKHPASDYLLNAHAVMACVARDRALYRKLRPELTRRLSQSAWSDEYSLHGCDAKMRWMR